MNKLFTVIILLFYVFQLKAQGVRGVVYGEDEEPLPFATIYVQETGSGTSANQEAYYELQLKPGKYTLQYKFVGYESFTKVISVEDQNIQLNVELTKQSLLLDEVTTTAKATDPANWMMRKAIAKSSYHRQQIDAYSGKVYVKGKGKVNSIPLLLRGRLKKEGIDTETLIITETISEVQYRRPNQFSEKVISIYASKKTDFNANPMRFITGSFYQDEIASVISPLSSKAFRYYKFKHLGAFMDDGYLINKIQVIPKVPAPNVFEGEIQLVEEDWALYRVDLNAQVELGIEVRIRQVYQNINDLAWMPITHQFDVEGNFMGVGFEGKYLASVSNYEIELNPALPKKIKILDKDDAEQGKMTEEIITDAQSLSKNEDKKQIVVKSEDLSAIMKDYKKSQRDSLAKQDIIGVYDFKVDSGAYSQDSVFWAQVRPIPLSMDENRGYAKIDSLNIIQDEKESKDSLKRVKNSTFQMTDIIRGGSYYLDSAKTLQFKIYNALLSTQYNTVEGLNVDYSIGLKKFLPTQKDDSAMKGKIDLSYYKRPYALIKPTFRYAVARNTLTGKVLTKYRFKTGDISFRIGRYIQQFNEETGIQPLINTSFSTIWEQNFMKIYEKDFLQLNFENRTSAKFKFSSALQYEERKRLNNNTDFKTIDWRREFTPNYPININPIDEFDGQTALTAHFKAEYRPFVKYVIRNGIKRPVFNRSTIFEFKYYKGFKGIVGSEVDFDRLEMVYKDQYDFGAKGRTYISTTLGAFLNNSNLGFMDYAHFPGNRAFITQADPVQSFRLLDYYRFSTDQFYVQNFIFHRFRKLMVTQFPATRFMGLKEGAFLNYLYTPDSNNYAEIGYSLDGILKFFRIEVATQYENFQYKGWGLRVGISTTLGNNISINVNDDE